MPEHPPEKPMDKDGFGFQLFIGLLWGWGFVSTYLLRYGEGSRGASRFGLYGLFAVALYAVFAPCEALFAFGLLYCVAVVVRGVIARISPPRPFQFYEGDFLLRLLFPFIPEEFAKSVLEPFIVGMAGYWLKQVDAKLGIFFIVGGCLSAFRAAIEARIRKAKDDGWQIMREEMESDQQRRQARGW